MPAAIKATLALVSGKHHPFTVTEKGRTGDVRRNMPMPGLLVGLLVGSAVSALWSACSYLAVFRRSLHRMHGVPDSRSPWPE